ncbi:MAG: hypothetical protein JO180_05715 [Gemmatirosa sp.]|nr:hypothetical protein [Gemmatirosa sp.]
MNRSGGSRAAVRDAVGLLDAARTPDQHFAAVAESERKRFAGQWWQFGEYGTLASLPTAVRLSLEMAAHEDAERRALEGELGDLERAWRQAEQIAAIADDLLVPDGVRGALARLKGDRA